METEIQKIIDYIENNLFDINFAQVVRFSARSKSEVEKMFRGILGVSVSEYIRKRRLSVAAVKLREQIPVNKLAEILRYENTESFTRAFKHFYGMTPTEARHTMKPLKHYNRLRVQCVISGGDELFYKTVELPKLVLCGYKRRMHGHPADRFEQEREFFEETREQQELLRRHSVNPETENSCYTVVQNINSDGFDFYIAYDCMGKAFPGFERIVPSPGKYLCFETPKSKYPTRDLPQLRTQIEEDFSPRSLQIVPPSEINSYHWFTEGHKDRIQKYIEILIPV